MGVISGYQLIYKGQQGPAAPTGRLRRLLSSIHMVNHRQIQEKTPDPIPEESSSPVIGGLLNDAATLQYFALDIFSINFQWIEGLLWLKMAQRERTPINGNQKETLKSFFTNGMTRVGSKLIPSAASATGLDTSVIENWIGNYKRSQISKPLSEPRQSKAKVHVRELSPYNLFCRDIFKNKGTMNDIKGRWATLGEDEKNKYFQEAAALRAHGQTQDLSPEMRDARIKMHLKKLKLEVSKLEDLGVETAILSFDRQKSSLEVFELSSKGATDFLDTTETVNNFALHFKASSSPATPSTREHVSVLVGKVQDLFNQKYKEAGGTGRLPYQSLVNQGMTINVAGLPTSLTLRKPSFYGRNQLVEILKAAEEISFEISK
ncbi:uncharacterized protein LOC123987515 isoform X1 [Micropterus dolomieu]|uniref:uncharacterized protein LOC123987515 isoform X1 n=1 Tax=Micropterus dolomieu TaxID=147949 RepID=UPI001E8CBA12|nr:uncharacterized protein LOC123987515 isoform X1 [Micropterus dolomieu]